MGRPGTQRGGRQLGEQEQPTAADTPLCAMHYVGLHAAKPRLPLLEMQEQPTTTETPGNLSPLPPKHPDHRKIAPEKCQNQTEYRLKAVAEFGARRKLHCSKNQRLKGTGRCPKTTTIPHTYLFQAPNRTWCNFVV